MEDWPIAVTLDLGLGRGDRQSFQTFRQLIDYVERQDAGWTHRVKHLEPFDRPDPTNGDRNLKALRYHWGWFKQHLEEQRGLVSSDPDSFAIQASEKAKELQLIDNNSLAAVAFDHVAKDGGRGQTGGAAAAMRQAPHAMLFPNLTYEESVGALKFIASFYGLDVAVRDVVEKGVKHASRAFSKELAEHRQTIADHKAQINDSRNEIGGLLQQAKTDFDGLRETAATDFDAQKSAMATEWSKLTAAYSEQLKLEAPAKLWTDRAVTHRRSARRHSVATFMVGSLGFLVAPEIVRIAAFYARIIITPIIGPATMVTGRIAELAVVAGFSLLYPTLYLWFMRILVRMMMTEHHLAIDAEARSAMAETYLALTKEGAAADADRLVILAALFKPVADGLVNDDALPLLTPAALASSLLKN